jgi:predicted DsbA family dithiol-disulfide isomerase
MQVEIWSDVVCPWCYLGKRRFEKALAEFPHGDEVTVVHRSFQLDPTAPRDHTVATSELLSTKYGLPPERVDQMQREMTDRAAADGLDYRLDGQQSGNTVDAHRLVHLAAACGRQDELVERLYQAYFSEQRSVFGSESRAEIAVEAGLDDAEVRDVLAGDAYADAVASDIADAQRFGLNGVPAFVIDRTYLVSGAQPPEAILTALERAWAEQVAAA